MVWGESLSERSVARSCRLRLAALSAASNLSDNAVSSKSNQRSVYPCLCCCLFGRCAGPRALGRDGRDRRGGAPKFAWPDRRIGASQTAWNFEEYVSLPTCQTIAGCAANDPNNHCADNRDGSRDGPIGMSLHGANGKNKKCPQHRPDASCRINCICQTSRHLAQYCAIPNRGDRPNKLLVKGAGPSTQC